MICALVLAAGRSRRMGTQKLLLPVSNSTLIAHVVDQVLAGVVERVYVVVAPEGDAIAHELSGRPVTIVANPNAEAQMLDSVRCGLRALPANCEAVLVALGDQPTLSSALINEMVAAYRDSGQGIVVPAYGGRRGHPLLFAIRFRDEILTGHDEVGLRGLLRDHAEDVHELRVTDSAVLSDMDYPEDYRRELARLNQDVPD